MATDQSAGLPMRVLKLLRPPVLEAPAQEGRTLAELRAIDAARNGEVGMGVHVIDAPGLIDAIDDADMGVGVIDHRAGTDAAGLQGGRIEIRRDLAVAGGIDTEGAGIDIVQHGADGGRRIDAAAMIDHARTAEHMVGAVAEARAGDAIGIGKGQPVLPGVIGAQQIGQLGAIHIDVEEAGVAAPPGIGRIAQAALGGGTAGIAQRGDEAAKARLVGRIPMILDDPPRIIRGGGLGAHTAQQQDQENEKDPHNPVLTLPAGGGAG